MKRVHVAEGACYRGRMLQRVHATEGACCRGCMLQRVHATVAEGALHTNLHCIKYNYVREGATHMSNDRGCTICCRVRSVRPSRTTNANPSPRQVIQCQPPDAPKNCTRREQQELGCNC